MGSKKLIQESRQIEAILANAKFIRLALSDPETSSLYLVPLSFGYKDNVIYFHSSSTGKKIDIIRKNPRVCFEADIETEVIIADDPCKYNVRYRSVIGHGQAHFVEDYDQKVEGLIVLSEHYGEKGPFEFEAWKVNRLCVIRIEIEKMTGKESGFLSALSS
ncbi:pyridoxamine 5'-phosphate oxidase family protein [Methanosarcina sp.]|uniref:pyridoxamine 5'-phosphate oxidase family protein n=1 Tax=Methanosarcina sp. TaxID=2213 RepID=UPI002ABA10C7|nr:pyridoxamine 5'-phosphate oxidase family protein [Methanosarcina sp.]MDY9925280.1 pyridoxamine 5'-phosphate oxidase family protein [Methanosarcina sp.]